MKAPILNPKSFPTELKTNKIIIRSWYTVDRQSKRRLSCTLVKTIQCKLHQQWGCFQIILHQVKYLKLVESHSSSQRCRTKILLNSSKGQRKSRINPIQTCLAISKLGNCRIDIGTISQDLVTFPKTITWKSRGRSLSRSSWQMKTKMWRSMHKTCKSFGSSNKRYTLAPRKCPQVQGHTL